MKYTNPKVVIGVLFAVSLTVANITAAKIAYFDLPVVGGAEVPAGFVAIGVAFLCTDLLGELYGKEHARNVVNATVIGLIFAWGLIYVSILMPAAPFYDNSMFTTVMGGSATIITAGLLTTLLSQNIDVHVFHRIDQYTGGGRKWARNLGSTTVAQFVDTSMFILLGFVALPFVFGGSVVTPAVAVTMIVGQYTVKLAVAALDTPLFYIVSGVIN